MFAVIPICAIVRGVIIATDKLTITPLAKDERVIPFELFPELRVKRVVDESSSEMKFIQEDKDEDADFAVILPSGTQLGSVTLVGNTSLDIKDIVLPQEATKVAVCAINDVLASSIQNKKR